MKKYWISLSVIVCLVGAYFYIQPSEKTEPKKQEKPGSIAYGSSGFGDLKKGQGRIEWEIQRLKDPETGKLPGDYRKKELEYARKYLSKNALKDKSSKWVDRGPYNVGGRTRALVMDKRDENTLWAGAVSGGIWRTTDAGASWSKITPSTQIQNVTCIAQDQREGKEKTWYYGTGESLGNSASGPGAFYLGNGIYKTTDDGETWTSLSETATNSPNAFDSGWDLVYRLALDNSDTTIDRIYAAALNRIARSDDGGDTWVTELGGGAQSSLQSTDVLTTSDGTTYATLSSISTNRGIWRTTDGENWTSILDANFPSNYNRIVMAVNPMNENSIYFLATTPGSGQVSISFQNEEEYNSLWKYTYVSGDGTGSGGIWTDLSSSIPHGSSANFDNFYAQGAYDLVIKVKPDDSNTVVIGGTNLYISTDGFTSGNNTNQIGGYTPGTSFPDFKIYENHHPDNHELIFMPSNPNILFSGSDGGVHRTDDMYADTVVWTSLNNGYRSTQLYAVGFNPSTTDDIMVGGFQDNGNFYTNSEDPKSRWVLPLNGDGAFMGIANAGNPYYLSIQQGKIFKLELDSVGGVNGFRRIDPIGGSGYSFINPFVLDPNNNDLMYVAGGRKVWRNDDLSSIPLTNEWDSIAQGWTSYSDTILALTETVTSIAVSKNPANILYYGTSDGKMYKITDAHTGDPTPINITKTRLDSRRDAFPTRSTINSIAINPNDADEVLIAFSNYNEYSLFYTRDGGTTWAKVGGALEEQITGRGAGPSCRSVAILPYGDSTMYLVGTSVGLFAADTLLYESADSALNTPTTDWRQVEIDRIGNVVVEMIQIRTTDGLIAVATHGNGIYSTKINRPPSSTSSITPTACLFYTTPSGKRIENSGMYMDTIRNVAGGDSIISIDLSVTKPDTSVTRTNFELKANQDNASYQWIDCTNGDTAIAGATSQTYTVIKNGTYAVAVTVDNCTDTSSCVEVVNVGLNEVDFAEQKLNISPNPSKGIFNLNFKAETKNPLLVVRSINGTEVYREQLNGLGSESHKIDLGDISPGLYFLTIENYGVKLIITN